MSYPVVCGIDPSIAGTAICHGTIEAGGEVVQFPSKARGDDLPDRIRRLELLMSQVKAHLDKVAPDVILIEGYSFGSNNRAEAMAEWGGLLRWHLLDYTPNVYEIAPLSLKKFITGKGAGKKEMMIAHVTKKWDRIFETNDHVDAFALYQFGLRLAGNVPTTNGPQREVIKKVIGNRPLKLDAQPIPF